MSSAMIMAGGDAMTAAALGEFHLTLTVAGDVEGKRNRTAINDTAHAIAVDLDL